MVDAKKKDKTAADVLAEIWAATMIPREQLTRNGMSTHAITDAVRQGRLLRVRRGVYALPDTKPEIISAVRVGGRLTCLTLLSMIGVFVLSHPALHVHVPAHLSRSRRRRPGGAVLHWAASCTDDAPLHVVSLHDAVLQSIRCQSPRAAIATLDSLLHHRLLTMQQLAAIIAELPVRFATLLDLADASSESGPETFMRLILRSLGLRFETQVEIPGVGRVDFVVEGWLIIECDSKAHHEGWDKQVTDRRRDLEAARRGYVTIRPIAADLLGDSASVRTAVREVIATLGPSFRSRRAPQLRRSTS